MENCEDKVKEPHDTVRKLIIIIFLNLECQKERRRNELENTFKEIMSKCFQK